MRRLRSSKQLLQLAHEALIGVFYTAVAVSAAIIVFAGFARTYFLRPLFYVLSLSALLHLHSFITSLGFVVFFLQVRLIAARRVNLHRHLGLAAAFLVPTISLLGVAVVVVVGRDGFTPDRPPAPYFVAMIFWNLIVFFAWGWGPLFSLALRRPQAVDDLGNALTTYSRHLRDSTIDN